MSSHIRTALPDSAGFQQVWKEFAIRIIIITGFIITEDVSPFWRQIQQEEVWLYSYPTTPGFVTSRTLYVFVVTACVTIICVFFAFQRNFREAYIAVLTAGLALPLTGLITNFIKISVGRPRPDYYARCLPGVTKIDATVTCTGDLAKVMEGRKSFPSGHSSMSFAAMGFIALYLAGKLCIFHARGRGKSWRLLAVLTPLVCALLVAISRTCDYHHHWQDITVGSILGLAITYLVYRQYYPSLSSPFSPLPYAVVENEELDAVDLRSNSDKTDENPTE